MTSYVKRLVDESSLVEISSKISSFNVRKEKIIVKYKNEKYNIDYSNERLSKLLNSKILQDNSL